LYFHTHTHNLFSLGLALLLGAAAFTALGLALTSLIRSAEGSSAVVNAIYLPVSFLSGAFFSPHSFPAALKAIANALPLVYVIRLVRDIALQPADLGSPGRRGRDRSLGARRGDRGGPPFSLGAAGRLGFANRGNYEFRWIQSLSSRSTAAAPSRRASRFASTSASSPDDPRPRLRSTTWRTLCSPRWARSRSWPRSATRSARIRRRRCTRCGSRWI